MTKDKTPSSRVTIRAIADAAQVSRMTVLRVIQGKPDVSLETRNRINEVMEQLGYKPDQKPQIRASHSRILGLLTPDVGTLHAAEILRGIARATEHLKYGLQLYSQRKEPDSLHEQNKPASYYLSSFEAAEVEGVLLIFPHDYEVIIRGLKERHIPYVILDHQKGTTEEPGITASNRKGVLDAMRHLLALGHRRIGFITGKPELVASHERWEGYRDGLLEVGIAFDPDLVREGDFTQPTGFQQAQSLLDMENPPTAIMASNDMMAFGVMDAAKLRGMTIGQDISIIGFDDIYQAAQSYPPLTTVRQPLDKMGQSAVELLLTFFDGASPLTIHREIPTELIIRETTGRVPNL